MTEYQFQKCKVRIHGTTGPDNIREATEKILKEVLRNEKKKKRDDDRKAS